MKKFLVLLLAGALLLTIIGNAFAVNTEWSKRSKAFWTWHYSRPLDEQRFDVFSLGGINRDDYEEPSEIENDIDWDSPQDRF